MTLRAKALDMYAAWTSSNHEFGSVNIKLNKGATFDAEMPNAIYVATDRAEYSKFSAAGKKAVLIDYPNGKWDLELYTELLERSRNDSAIKIVMPVLPIIAGQREEAYTTFYKKMIELSNRMKKTRPDTSVQINMYTGGRDRSLYYVATGFKAALNNG